MARLLQKLDQEPYRGDNKEVEREHEKVLADVIYLFLEEGGKGIRLYDRTDEVDKSDSKKDLNDGEFIVDTAFDEVEWDKEINGPKTPLLVRYREGSRKETTYIVSEEKLQEVLSTIEKAREEEKNYCTIDTNERIINNLEGKTNISPKNIAEADKKYGVTPTDINRIDELLLDGIDNIKEEKGEK